METQLLQNVVLLAVDVSVCFVLCCFFFYFHLLVWCTLPLQHTLCLGKTCLTCGLVHLKGDKQKVTSIQYIFLPQGGNVAKLLFFPSPVCFLPSLRRDGISVRTAGLQPQLLLGSSVCPFAFVNVSTIQQPTHRHQRGRANAATLGTILQWIYTVCLCALSSNRCQEYLVTTPNDSYNGWTAAAVQPVWLRPQSGAPPNTHTAAEA